MTDRPPNSRRTLVLSLVAMLIGCSPESAGEDNSPRTEKDDLPGTSFFVAGHRYRIDSLTQFKLPVALREISGLTLDAEDRLFGHDDESAVIYEIDYHQGRILRQFALQGDLKADFEGIAATPEHLYLITSSGTLFETTPGQNGATVPFTRYPAELDCEVEGLTYLPAEQTLMAACKNLSKKKKNTAVRMYRWPLARRSFERSDFLKLAKAALDDSPQWTGQGRIQPTGVTLAPNGNLVTIAGRQRLLLELTHGGSLVGIASLPLEAHHPQAEGIAITRDHLLLIADEGLGKGKQKSEGRLSVYRPDQR